MLLYPLSALLNPLPDTLIIKGNANNGRNPPSCPFLVIAFSIKEATGCINKEAISAINEAAIGATIAPKKSTLFFYISCNAVLVATFINRSDFSTDSRILIISSISSF